jgi:hypothetical protein
MGVEFQLRLNAGPHDRHHCPVSFRLDRDSAELDRQPLENIAMYDEKGVPIPVQAIHDEKGCTLHWIADGLKAHERIVYTVVSQDEASVQKTGDREGNGPAAGNGVALAESEQKLDIFIEGRYFTSYVFDPAFSKPYIGPVAGPNGISYTRLDFETKEHPHHRSIWLGIGDVNGIDIWNEPAGRYGRQTVKELFEKTSGPVLARIGSALDWTDYNGRKQMSERRVVTIYRMPESLRIIDLEFELKAEYGRVELGATKEAGPLGIRVAEPMKADRGGRMVNSYGSVGEAECWGKRAEWCDYSGTVDGHLLGIAAFDHPSNDGFPAHWHIRDYGLMAPNNFYFRGGKLLQPGESIRYKYRLLFHEGSLHTARLSDRYQDYIHPPAIEAVK